MLITTFSISMYIMCVILRLFSTLSCKLGALQISIIIIITTAKHLIQSNSTLHNHQQRGVRNQSYWLRHACQINRNGACFMWVTCTQKRGKSDTESHNALWLLQVSKLVFYAQSTATVSSGQTLTGKIYSVPPL